jgi:hypothetical protein
MLPCLGLSRSRVRPCDRAIALATGGASQTRTTTLVNPVVRQRRPNLCPACAGGELADPRHLIVSERLAPDICREGSHWAQDWVAGIGEDLHPRIGSWCELNGGGIDVCVEWTRLFEGRSRRRPLVGKIVEQVGKSFEHPRA